MGGGIFRCFGIQMIVRQLGRPCEDPQKDDRKHPRKHGAVGFSGKYMAFHADRDPIFSVRLSIHFKEFRFHRDST
jgi:hypothetical protein